MSFPETTGESQPSMVRPAWSFHCTQYGSDLKSGGKGGEEGERGKRREKERERERKEVRRAEAQVPPAGARTRTAEPSVHTHNTKSYMA